MKKSLLILFAILVLSACQSSSPPAPAASPEIAASPMSTEILPTPTIATEVPYPYPPPTSGTPPIRPEFPTPDPLWTPLPPEPTQTPQPLDLSGVWFAKLLDDQQGWVLSDGNLLGTDDTGQRWRQITPTGIGEGFIQHAFFLDSQQAWGVICDNQPIGDFIKVTYTSDGGSTWGVSEVTSMQEIVMFPEFSHGWCGKFKLGRIFFLNAYQGWILIDTTLSANSLMGEMFQTLDGGQTWQHLGTSPRGEFFFVSETTGWMRATCCTGGPMQLYRTEDGGKSWQGIGVNGSDQNDDLYVPVFFDQQVGIMAVNLYDEQGISEGVTFFKTQDGGESWNIIGKLPISPTTDDLTIHPRSVQIWDEQTWVVTFSNLGVYWTLDGGQHWTENTTEIARSIDEIVTLGSATSGWGLICDQGSWPHCAYLMVTEDMGAHWEKVEVQP